MKLIIDKNRKVYSAGTWGTVNENDYEILDFEFPAELDGYNKRIVYYLGNERVWDTIVNNKAYITNAITTKGDVKAYVWCTKENTEREADTDFRTMLFDMHFYENENADGIVPTEVQVDGFNTMLTAMNAKIDEVDALEQTIGAAETQRQEAEATRVSNENTRESNESTRQTNEQTRQTQEAERERRTDEAIGNIEDKTAEYNANAEAKTTAFNNNATQKINEFNSNYTQKVNDFDTYVDTAEQSILGAGNYQVNRVNNAGNTNRTAIQQTAGTALNSIVQAREAGVSAVETASSEATTNFNTNATNKTNAFNDNATSKTNDFNDNASEKTDEFNTNAQNKIDEYDEHIVEYQAQIDELQEEVEELSENMPWNTTKQATEISVDDAAKYSRNKLELFSNTEQDNTKMTYKCDGTETGDYYLTYNNIDYYFTMPTITEGDILVFNTTDLKLYLGDTEITTESTGTGTNLTFIPSPNPDYSQDIHVVTGNNSVGVQGKNLAGDETLITINSSGDKRYGFKITKPGTYTLSYKKPQGSSLYCSYNYYENGQYSAYQQAISPFTFTITQGQEAIVYNETANKTLHSIGILDIQIELGSATSYEPYYHADYPINLGNIELCKIGDYQDYLYKENGNWYKYEAITKIILDGTENWKKSGVYKGSYYIERGTSSKFYVVTAYSPLFCSRFIRANINYAAQMSNYKQGTCFVENTDGNFDVWYDDGTSTPEDFRSWVTANNLVVYCVLKAPNTTQITDEALISQLDAIYNHLALVKGTNNITVTAEDLKPLMKLSYMQDLKSKLDNLDSRLSLLE